MDIINPVIERPVINVEGTTVAGILVMTSIPGIKVGFLKRLTITNPTVTDANIMVQDLFSPDSSIGDPTPPATVTANRFPAIVPAGDMLDINGHTISKHLGSVQITSDVAGCLVSGVVELE